MKIAITGGSGFIGKNLIAQLAKVVGNEIIVFDRHFDAVLSTYDNVEQRLMDFDISYGFDFHLQQVDVLYHLVTTSTPATARSLVTEITNNVLPSTLMFEAAVRQGVKKIIFLSSGGAVYGGDTAEHHSETDILLPLSTYGEQKLMIERSLAFTTQNTDTDYAIIRLSNPYGPGQNPKGALGLVTKLVYQALTHAPITIYGDGENIRDFIYIDDAIQGILDIVANGADNQIYNLGTGQGASVNEILERVTSEVGVTAVNYVSARQTDVRVSVLDISKFKQITSLTGFVSLSDGIQKTKDFFQESGEIS
ncbi:NAD-dependent epimerase/dehydratase family protein [Lactococcus insecticola]|uniref:UDP-glucose 4-epimerase n=1 Tax=Pseudolactococcus insecticola TaxID=2709158 RepID=A0A6A0B461_9LACT|nr:NAD-dependent epimerase/dehydratase family protein [Lactococcus insecticola]GFH39942.1 UDP-glucose 4-epimerase [Lactococcus insecticola]